MQLYHKFFCGMMLLCLVGNASANAEENNKNEDALTTTTTAKEEETTCHQDDYLNCQAKNQLDTKQKKDCIRFNPEENSIAFRYVKT